MRLTAAVCVLSLLLGGIALMPSSVGAAPWISGADSYRAPWVKDIEQELFKKDYRQVFLNDPRTPQASVLTLLNQAAAAYNANERATAQDLVNEAIGILEDGVRRHYYTKSDIEPITSFIRQHVPVKAS